MCVLGGLRLAALSKTAATGSGSCGGQAESEPGRSSSPSPQVGTLQPGSKATPGQWLWVLATPLQQVLCCG